MDQAPPPPPPPALGTTILLSVSMNDRSSKYFIELESDSICFFGGWVMSLSTLSSKVHPHCSMYQNFLLSWGWVILHCMYISHFIHPFVCRWILASLSPFGYLTALCISVDMQVSLQDPAFSSSGLVPRSEFVKSNGNSIFTFWWRRHHPVSHTGLFLHSTNGAQEFWFLHIFSNP